MTSEKVLDNLKKVFVFLANGMEITLRVAHGGIYRIERKVEPPTPPPKKPKSKPFRNWIWIYYFFNKRESQAIHKAENNANAPPLPNLVEWTGI